MGTFDAIAAILLAVGVVRGFKTGLFRQVGSVVGLLVAFAVAAGLMTTASSWVVAKDWASADTAPILAFLAIFLVVYVVILLVASFVEEAFETLKLGFVSRIGGAAFGALKTALILSVALVVLAYGGVPSAETRSRSKLYRPLSTLAPTAWSYVSSNAETLDELTKRLEVEIGRIPLPDSVSTAAPRG